MFFVVSFTGGYGFVVDAMQINAKLQEVEKCLKNARQAKNRCQILAR
jgi:hypothetical protein